MTHVAVTVTTSENLMNDPEVIKLMTETLDRYASARTPAVGVLAAMQAFIGVLGIYLLALEQYAESPEQRDNMRTEIFRFVDASMETLKGLDVVATFQQAKANVAMERMLQQFPPSSTKH